MSGKLTFGNILLLSSDDLSWAGGVRGVLGVVGVSTMEGDGGSLLSFSSSSNTRMALGEFVAEVRDEG